MLNLTTIIDLWLKEKKFKLKLYRYFGSNPGAYSSGAYSWVDNTSILYGYSILHKDYDDSVYVWSTWLNSRYKSLDPARGKWVELDPSNPNFFGVLDKAINRYKIFTYGT